MSVVINFGSDIYPAECINATVKVYADLCSIKLIESSTGTTAEVAANEDELKVVDEFLNYALMRSIEFKLMQTTNE